MLVLGGGDAAARSVSHPPELGLISRQSVGEFVVEKIRERSFSQNRNYIGDSCHRSPPCPVVELDLHLTLIPLGQRPLDASGNCNNCSPSTKAGHMCGSASTGRE